MRTVLILVSLFSTFSFAADNDLEKCASSYLEGPEYLTFNSDSKVVLKQNPKDKSLTVFTETGVTKINGRSCMPLADENIYTEIAMRLDETAGQLDKARETVAKNYKAFTENRNKPGYEGAYHESIGAMQGGIAVVGISADSCANLKGKNPKLDQALEHLKRAKTEAGEIVEALPAAVTR